jgi:hypothetical protein
MLSAIGKDVSVFAGLKSEVLLRCMVLVSMVEREGIGTLYNAALDSGSGHPDVGWIFCRRKGK